MPVATDSRQESDSLGTVNVPHSALWGAQTQRALANFDIGHQTFPSEFIRSFALVKKAAVINGIGISMPTRWCEGAGWHIAPIITHKSGVSWAPCPPPSAMPFVRPAMKLLPGNMTSSSRWWCGKPAAAPRPI